MAIGLTTNIGQVGLRFVAPLTGIASPQSIVRVVSGDARIGTDGLIVDRMTLGVMAVTVREVFAAGGYADTLFSIYGVEQVSGSDLNTAVAGKGLSDSAAKSAVANASTAYTGLKNIGVAR